MYTQCPECGVAFRVTAEVLKQAAGKVRCGGCGTAFNALEHLSEEKPAAPAPTESAPDPALPELKPEEPAELTADTPPQSISAEQSAALLKTLDQLAGEDIRIEDTGVEWRVIDDDNDDDIDDDAALPVDPEPSQRIDEMRFDDNTPLPEDFDFESTPSTPPAPRAEPAPQPEPEGVQVDLAFGEADEWDDLLGEVDEPAAAATSDDADDAVDAEVTEESRDDIELLAEPVDEEQPLDMDTQFQLQAEAMGIDLSGTHETVADDDEDEPDDVELTLDGDDDETSIEDDLLAAAFEAEAAVKAMEDSGARAVLQDEELEIDLQEEDEEEAEDDIEDIALGFDDKVEEVIETIAASLEDDEPEPEPKPDFDVDDVVQALAVPDLSEEEKTINMLIDQELLSVAVEDEDGFASTIVQLQPDDEVGKKGAKKHGKKKKKDEAAKPPKARPPVVETIVMEGDYVRDELDIAGADSGEEDPGISLPIGKADDDYARRGRVDHSRPSIGTISAALVLLLALLAQVVHQSREALATVPAFNSAVGPVYRMLGMPLTPTWNIQGWRFEATKGDVDETGQLLTVYSRVGNKSDESLPYPLVHLALTDRFEEPIGSTVFEPNEYLPDDADPRRLVPPGNTFNAVIAIESPSPDATSFKLNVCYRLASGQLRCQDASFK